ncbi:MAG: hypothetical protein ACJ75R_11485 [Solirubrobacterales bacterium]
MALRILVSALVFVVLVVVAGCGGSDSTTTSTVTTTVTGGQQTSSGAAQDTTELRAAVSSLRESVSGPKAKQPGAAPQGFSARGCGAGVYVKSSTTSCAFALNVARDYLSSPGYSFYSYSPVTGKTYLVHCTHGYPVLCRAGSARIVLT